MTLTLLFHHLHFRQFKSFYLDTVCRHLRTEFPWLPRAPPLCSASDRFVTLLKGEYDGIFLADATALAVSDNLRISRHKVFKGIAQRGKTLMGGFTLHIINSKGG